MREVRRLTLGELIKTVQDITRSDEEVVAVIAHWMRTRRLLRPKEAAAAC